MMIQHQTVLGEGLFIQGFQISINQLFIVGLVGHAVQFGL